MAKPERPEPKFFLANDPGPEGVSGYLAAHYGEHPVRARGEKSTSYLDHPHAWSSVLRAFPDARFVVVLRDPVKRAISHWCFSSESGLEELPAERALCDEDLEGRPYDRRRVSTSPYAYLSRGRYAASLHRLFAGVGRQRVMVAFLEELRADTHALRALVSFVGGGDGDVPVQPGPPVNASRRRRVPASVYDFLVGYYAGPNQELSKLLGRPLPASWRHGA